MSPQKTSETLPLSAKARRTPDQPISFLISAVMANPRLINLAAGLVDPLTLPVEECNAITRKLFSDPQRGRAALQYDTTMGLKELRGAALGIWRFSKASRRRRWDSRRITSW